MKDYMVYKDLSLKEASVTNMSRMYVVVKEHHAILFMLLGYIASISIALTEPTIL